MRQEAGDAVHNKECNAVTVVGGLGVLTYKGKGVPCGEPISVSKTASQKVHKFFWMIYRPNGGH